MTDLPASQVDAAFGLPLPLPASNARFRRRRTAFGRRVISLWRRLLR
jgi:hypothetical protein